MNLRRPRKPSAPPTVYVGDYTHKLSRIPPLPHSDDERQCREDQDYAKNLFTDPAASALPDQGQEAAAQG